MRRAGTTYILMAYKNVFGAPGTGVHRWRVAVVDTALTILLAFGIFKIFNFKSFWIVLLWTLVVGEVFHWLACTKTQVIKFIGI